jgi:hypothetical protein
MLFVNLCLAETVYLSETFQSNSASLPKGWKSLDLDTSKLHPKNNFINLLTGNGWGNWDITHFSKGSWAVSSSYFATDGQADDWLITREIDLGADAILTWEGKSENYTSGKYQSYQVLISTASQDTKDFVLLYEKKNESFLNSKKIDLKDYAGKKIYLAFRNISQNVVNGYLYIGKVKVFTPNVNDLSISRLMLPYSDTLGCSKIPIKASFKSNSNVAIDSFELNYQINDRKIHTATIKCKMSFGEIYYIAHPDLWEPDSALAYRVKVWVSKVNGVKDTVMYGNEITQNIYIGNKHNHNLPLFEEFTSSTCGACATANKFFDPFLKNHTGNYTLVKYQMVNPAPGDLYYNYDGYLRLMNYGINGIPDLFVNGTNRITPSDTAKISTFKYGVGLIDIKGTYYVYKENGDYKIKVDVDIESNFIGNGSDQLVLYVAVVENKTTKNASTNGEKEFISVEQKMLPDGKGTPLTDLLNIDKLSKSFNFTFDSTSHVEEYNDLSVVIFIQDKTTKEVLGNTWATWTDTGVENSINDGNGIVSLFPNPATNHLYVRYNVRNQQNAILEIYNIEGKNISSYKNKINDDGSYLEDININGLDNGLYFIKLIIGNNTYSKSFVINK